MVVIGEPPHPQVMFAGYDSDDPDLAAMAALVPTADLLPAEGFRDLRSVEWDILVSRGLPVEAPGHMHVLAFACEQVGLARTDSGAVSVSYGGRQTSQVLVVSDTLPDSLRRLVVGELVPWLQQQPARPHLTTRSQYGELVPFKPGAPDRRVPFVLEADGGVIAGAFERQGGRTGGGWCWSLPHVPAQPAIWLAAALADWHERTPHRVPALPTWRRRSQWATAREETALRTLEVIDVARQRVQRDLDDRELRARAELEASTAAAEEGQRRLLTAQGRSLVLAVIQALLNLGFEVEDVDGDEAAVPGEPKVEDLRVRDVDDPDWSNVTEVRGYTGGAKVSDFQRLGRFAALYAGRTGGLPGSRWYIVNQFCDADPDTRRHVLAGSEDDIQVFAEDGGVVVDTRELFRLVRLVEEGRLPPTHVRKIIRRHSGVLRVEDVLADSEEGP